MPLRDASRLVKWSRSTGASTPFPPVTPERPMYKLTALAAPSPGLVIAGYEDGTVDLWEPRTLTLLGTLRGAGGAVRHIALDRDQWIAVSDDEGVVTVWEREPAKGAAREPIAHLRVRGRSSGAPLIAFDRGDTPALITVDTDGQVMRWSLGGPLPEEAPSIIQHARDEADYGH
jgi:hypothetical protein